MLRGKDLRRRHERGLKAVFCRGKHQRRRNNGFARADVALQKAVHRLALFHVVHRLSNGSFLRVSQLKGERTDKKGSEVVMYNDVGSLLVLSPEQKHTRLQNKKLFKNQPPARNFRVLETGRKMNVFERKLLVTKVEFSAYAVRYRVARLGFVVKLERVSDGVFNRFV